MEQTKNTNIIPSKNVILHKDNHPLEQPDGSCTFNLNVVNATSEGENTILHNEPSNIRITELSQYDDSYQIIGDIAMNDNQVCLFITNNTISIIGIFKDGNFTELINTDCLSFNKANLIKGVFKIINGCDKIISFYDGVNEDKYLNLDRLSSYHNQAFLDWLVLNPGSTTVDYHNATGLHGWDCNKMKLNPDFIYPNIELQSVNDQGGSLYLGTYQFALELLDNSFNRLAFTQLTNSIPINSKPLTAQVSDGGYNLINHTVDQGGVPISNKSITLNFNNVNDPITYVRLVVVRAITGDGLTKEGFIINDYINVNDSNIIHTFTGVNTDKDLKIDLAEITVNKVVYPVSKSQAIVDSRLVRANVNEKQRNYFLFQKYASQIVTNYVVKPRTFLDAAKDPTYYSKPSFLRDEIYSLGIVYVFKDGSYSPVFHIPGRPKNTNTLDGTSLNGLTDKDWVSRPKDNSNWDDTTYEVVADGSEDYFSSISVKEAAVAGYNINDKAKRWKLYNTAWNTRNDSLIIFNGWNDEVKGVLGYYECEDTYPVITSCNSNDYWGQDYWGNNLVNTPIRHHRIPDATLERLDCYVNVDSLIYTEQAAHIELECTNINIPTEYADEIVGYFIVKGDKNVDNTTVVDKGYLRNTVLLTNVTDSNYQTFYRNPSDNTPYGSYTDQKIGLYFSNKSHLLNNVSQTSYLKTEYFLDQSVVTFLDGSSGCDLEQYLDKLNIRPYTGVSHKSVSQGLLKSIIQCDTDNLDNRVVYSMTGFLPNETVNLFYASKPVFLDADLYRGDLNNYYDSQYVSLKNYRVNLDSNLFSVKYIKAHDNINSATETSCRAYGDYLLTLETDTNSFAYNVDLLSLHKQPCNWVFYYYTESKVNNYYRHHNENCYYHYMDYRNSSQSRNYVRTQKLDCQLNSCNIYKETILYNNDYSIIGNNLNIYTSLPRTFNYCSACIGQYPNRIIWSPKSFEEQNSENWKVNYANDYIDLEGSTGSITDLYFNRNKLLVNTEESAWLLVPNPQELQTSVSNLYIGVGDFLSIPPQSFVKKPFGYGGTINRFASVTSEYGHTWVDIQDGKVFNMTENIDEISMNGMSNWFKENLPYNLSAQLLQYGIDYCYKDSTVFGIGLNAIYDPYFKRYILHKTDYKMSVPFNGYKPGGDSEGTPNTLYIDTNCVFYIYNGGWQAVKLGDPLYFENKSWTISYSYTLKSWLSFHSFQPSYMFTDNNYFYSQANLIYNTTYNKSIYRHEHGEQYNRYYGLDYIFPSITEFVIKDINTYNLDAVYWVADCKKYNSTNKTYSDVFKTFDGLMVYNQNQNTGLLTLNLINQQTNPFGNLNYNSGAKSVIRTDNNYKVSQIFDMATGDPVISKAWSDLILYQIQGQGYIDIIPTNIDLTKNQFQLNQMKGKYNYIRLFYNPNDNQKIGLNLTMTNKLNSIR